MSEVKKFLVRASEGDIPADSEQEIIGLLEEGKCHPGSFFYTFETKVWASLAELSAVKERFFSKPPSLPNEKKVVYYMSLQQALIGPFSLREILEKEKLGELSSQNWVFVEGDKEWRQISSVKILREALPPLPIDHPEPPSAPIEMPVVEELSSVELLLQEGTPTQPTPTLEMPKAEESPAISYEPVFDSGIEQEEPTMAISALGLSAQPSPPPEMKKVPTPPQPAKPIPPPPSIDEQGDDFDGLTAEIPGDPIWLIKQANSELVSGPFRFLDVTKFIAEGKISKNDKISKVGSKSFVKIAQQYEFNVKYSVETVVEAGVEKQKIFIRRRHPRIPYLAPIQLVYKGATLAGTCVNVSAGGILMEVPKADFNLGDVLELKILPALIKQPISCLSLIIGKIPKIPPGYALRFQDLKPADKEAIEFFIQESLKREQLKP